MDESRLADLKHIDERLATRRTHVQTDVIQHRDPATGKIQAELVKTETYNPRLDKWGKEQAARARAGILADRKDKKLKHLREQLIRAAKAGDTKAEMQISAKIKAHKGERFEDYS